MKISELLISMAKWLGSPNNEAMLLAEYDDECLSIVASSCATAAEELKKAAELVDHIEPDQPSVLTAEGIDGLAEIATAFDESNDEGLKKQAAVIDELLLTIAAQPNITSQLKKLQDDRLEQLRLKYQQPREDQKKANGIPEIEKALQKAKIMQPTEIHDQPLVGRNCPSHVGAQLARVADHQWQCELGGEVYDYENGYTLENGTKVPGGGVQHQTDLVTHENHHAIFDTREGRLGTNKP
jgi:hypothetical protein